MDSKKIGVSVAASWAWGTGFIVGMGTMQEKGLIPFLIWGVANISTLVIFGLLFRVDDPPKIAGRYTVDVQKYAALGNVK